MLSKKMRVSMLRAKKLRLSVEPTARQLFSPAKEEQSARCKTPKRKS